MTRPPTLPRLSLRDPADVLAAVPYLLGFHPADSIVLLGLDDTALVFHARGDLPARGAPAAETSGFAVYLAQTLRLQPASHALLIGFGPPERVTPVMLATGEAVRATGITVLDQLRVTDGRYWSYLCGDPSCCPPEGKGYTVADTVVAAEATLAGCVALPDRESLVRTMAAPTGPALVTIRQATRRAGRRRGAVCAARIAAEARKAVEAGVARYTAGASLTDDEVAWLTVLLATGEQPQDSALADVARGGSGGVRLSAHITLWTDVVRRCDPAFVAAPAVLLAYACWRIGDGVRSGVAVDRALAADPQCPTAQLMAEVLRYAVPPDRSGQRTGSRRPPRGSRRRSRSSGG